MIPRKRNIRLLIALDFNEVEDHDGFAQDTTDYTFVMHASHQGGVLVVVQEEGEIDRAMVLASPARELVEGA